MQRHNFIIDCSDTTFDQRQEMVSNAIQEMTWIGWLPEDCSYNLKDELVHFQATGDIDTMDIARNVELRDEEDEG